jgi:hypothetical protein
MQLVRSSYDLDSSAVCGNGNYVSVRKAAPYALLRSFSQREDLSKFSRQIATILTSETSSSDVRAPPTHV